MSSFCIPYWSSRTKITDWTIDHLDYYSVFRESCDSNEPDRYIRFSINYIEAQKNVTIVIPLTDIDKRKSEKHFSSKGVYYHYASTSKAFEEFITSTVRNSINGYDPAPNYAVTQGYFKKPDGEYVFVLGQEILNGKESDPVIASNTMELKNHGGAENIPKYLHMMLSCGVIPPAAFVCALSAFVKPIFENENVQYGYTPFLHGTTGTGKTASVTILTDLFVNHDNVCSLSSDKMAIKKQSRNRDIPITVDDLNTTSSSRIRAANEAKIMDFIQQNQGAGTSKYKDVDARLNNVAFVTSEYVISNPSTVNRCVLILFEKAFDVYKMTSLQKYQHQYIEFLIGIITWLCKMRSVLEKEAWHYLKKYTFDSKPYEEHYLGFRRILRTQQILFITIDIFERYLKESLKLSDEIISEYVTECKQSVESCIAETFRYCRDEETKIGSVYYDAIFEGIKGYCNYMGKIVTDDFEVFLKNAKSARKQNKGIEQEDDPVVNSKAVDYLKRKTVLPETIFYFDGQYYCVEDKVLLAWLKEKLNLDNLPSKSEVSKQLIFHRLLKMSNQKATSRIRFPAERKASNRLYYRISFAILKERYLEEKENKRKHEKAALIDPFLDDYDFFWDGERRIRNKPYGTWSIEKKKKKLIL